VFTVIFAILQKSKILGDGKKQIDALVGLVVGLIVISFAQAVDIITQLVPFLAVSVVVILVLMIMIGAFHKEGDFDKAFPRPLRIVLTLVSIISLVAVMLYITGAWTYIVDIIFISSGGPSNVAANVVFIAVVIGAIVAVIYGSGGGKKSKSD